MSEATVIIEQGELRGKICKDYNGRTFYSFQGIPYAKPPVGDLRFKVSKTMLNYIIFKVVTLRKKKKCRFIQSDSGVNTQYLTTHSTIKINTKESLINLYQKTSSIQHTECEMKIKNLHCYFTKQS